MEIILEKHKDGTKTIGVTKDDLVHEIGKKLSTQWKELGRNLVIPGDRLDIINHDEYEVEEKAIQVFQHWKRNTGKNSTVKTLFRVLSNFCFGDASEYLREGLPCVISSNYEEVFRDMFLDEDYNIRDDIHDIFKLVFGIHGAYGIVNKDKNKNMPFEHLYVTVHEQERIYEEILKERIDKEFGWKASTFIEFRRTSSSSFRFILLGHVRARNSSSNLSQKFSDDNKCCGALTMFCRQNENYYALTCGHVACDTKDLQNDVPKITDVINTRNANDVNMYFYHPHNSKEEIQLSTVPCDTVSKFNSEADIMCIPVGNKDNFQRLGGDNMKNLALNFKEINEELYKTANSNKGLVNVRTSNHVTGFIIERNFSYIDASSTTIFKNAVKVKSSASFLEKGDSGTLVYFKDRKDLWRPFAYGVCKIDDEDDDDGDDDDDCYKYDNNGNCEDFKEYYLCLKLDKALKMLDLKDCEFFIEAENVNHSASSN
ncbi:uncharacterized protein LOC124439211 isoform X2 [Xenia sp. Carnegie-2017]|uniref:uncharacterized protein LOC124439211 isoform X2 n=1 Tax=Xenia sp. Carnegie-2017 TaxID=2897299 RepID=UPI001F03E328|nr:uncharacterized protein LOC124439211 isoform X2 [Xenia sp. Carnegie-2017]